MALVRWTPWQSWNRSIVSSPVCSRNNGATLSTESGQWHPVVDIRETADALLVQAELPGIHKEGVKIEVENGPLTLSGERRHEKKSDDQGIHRVERFYGRFVRTFSLPTHVDVAHVTAKMVNGVPNIRLPKAEHAKPKAITIEYAPVAGTQKKTGKAICLPCCCI